MSLPLPKPEDDQGIKDAQDVAACVHVEQKIEQLAFANVPHHQVEIARVGHRKTAYRMMTPAARAAAEKALRDLGILKVGMEPESPTGFNVRAFLDRGAATA